MNDAVHKARDERVYDEACALWRELYGEPPPIRADGGMMLEIITRSLPETDYDRIRSPHLRPANVTWPKSEESRAR